MSDRHYDFISIGGGSAGYAGARTARETRNRVAIVDGSPELGGLCILRGCMPSKTVLYSAEILHLAEQGERFGLKIPRAQADMPRMLERKRRMVSEFVGDRQAQLTSDRFDLYRRNARFTGPQEITLDDGTRLTADAFLIATGSRVDYPPIPGIRDVPVLTSDDILQLDYCPPSIVVLGAGYVGCELGQYLRRIGAEVTQIQRSPRILKHLPPNAAAPLEEAFRSEGIELLTDTHIEGLEKVPQGIRITFSHQGQRYIREASAVFNALGRRASTDSLNLSKADVETDSSGRILTNAYQQTSNPRVFAAGDCVGPYEIVHLAIMQAEVAGRSATDRPAHPVPYDSMLSVVFTDPQVALAGLTEEQLRDRGVEYAAAEFPFDDHGKSILMEARRGYVQVLAEKPTGRVVGAACVGKDASELIHIMGVAISLGATVTSLLQAHWYHPTLAEIWTYPLEDLAETVAKD